MAIPLSSYFNRENSFQTLLNEPEMMSSYCPFFHEETPPQLPPPDFSESFLFLNDNNANNLLFDDYYSFPAELTYPSPPLPQCQTPSLPLSHYNNNINIFPVTDDDQTFQCLYPKRRKLSFENNYHQIPYHSHNHFYDGVDQDNIFTLSSSCLMPEFNNHNIGVPPLPPVQPPVSPQSVAARKRRKKIAEKTVELGKMVPGGNEMNTADMLVAASKYVKYLQAQVSMLQLMNNTPTEDKAASWSDNQNQHLQAMLGSERVEEKLYLQEKCIVPQHLITTLTNHADIQTKPSILKDLNQLIIVSDPEKKQL
ncbi:hypothetical protein QN277_002337 [Acacia crassicarpa]|uniref:BHLH domain-containing protein n=1 Tax=Acacia crassicarpa TaxID=499986 RepID=A0AAE1N9C3_9FABA|nr:hypothetical protein QN277_002337 [Acacia crassicarpa]